MPSIPFPHIDMGIHIHLPFHPSIESSAKPTILLRYPPFLVRAQGYEREFSFEEQGTLPMVVVFLLIYVFCFPLYVY